MRILRCLSLVAAFGACVLSAAPSFACPPKGTVFQDNFTDQSGGWEPDPKLSFGSSGLTVTLAANAVIEPELNSSFFATNGDYCTDAVFPAAIANNAYVGLMFWAVDYNNNFLFQVSTSGHAQLYRKSNGNWISVMDQPAPAVKTAPSSSNELRVVAKGNLISMYVNGQKIADRRAQLPGPTNLRFGLWAQLDAATPAANARTFQFKDFTVN